MGLGSTAKKIQIVAERAEQVYEQIMELRKRVIGLEEAAETTSERVESLEQESEKQRVLLEAIAEEHGIDVEATLAEAAIEEVEGEATEGSGDPEADGTPAVDENQPADGASTTETTASE